LTRSPSHSCSWFAFRVFPEPSCHGPSPVHCRAVSRSSALSRWRHHGPPMEFLSLRRHHIREATYTGLSPPGCAASSGFLNLSTLRSARILSALFHADATQDSIFRGSPSTIASRALRRPLPLLLFSNAVLRPRRRSSRDSCTRGVRTRQAGVIRTLEAVPLLMFTPSRSPSLGLGALTGASSHGLRHAAGLEPKLPPVVVPALQSFKEPRS